MRILSVNNNNKNLFYHYRVFELLEHILVLENQEATTKKLWLEKLRSNIRKHTFTRRLVQDWNK